MGDVPPQQLLREVQIDTHAHHEVNVSIPPFNGRFRPALYIEWKLEINDIFASHNFAEHKKVKVAVGSLTG